jgi:hypothetical protein
MTTKCRLTGQDITGRDAFIVSKALFYAIKYVDSLPKWMQEKSDQADMVRLLKVMAPDYVAHRQALIDFYLEGVRADGVADNNVDQIGHHHIVRHCAIPEILVG